MRATVMVTKAKRKCNGERCGKIIPPGTKILVIYASRWNDYHNLCAECVARLSREVGNGE